MGRGNWRTTYKKGKYGSMPVARDTAFAPSDVSDKVMTENWIKYVGNPTPLKQLNKKYECTCNYREVKEPDGLYFVSDECKNCNSLATKKLLRLTDIEKKFSARHIRKVQEVFSKGDNIRKVMNRNV